MKNIDRNQSIEICNAISTVIATVAPCVDIQDCLEEMKTNVLKTDMDIRKKVLDELLMKCSLLEVKEDQDYYQALLDNTKLLYSEDFRKDAYLQKISVEEQKLDDILLTNVAYEQGELLQYDMPDLSAELVVPKIGFFDAKVTFPSVYQGVMPWVSVCPSEMNSMAKDIKRAYGRVLTLGLGLGYYTYMVHLKEDVESVTVVELNEKVIKLFKEIILPHFDYPEKIKIIHADALKYMDELDNGRYDFLYADIWESQVDGAECYQEIAKHEGRLYDMEFCYWIEKQIKEYIGGL